MQEGAAGDSRTARAFHESYTGAIDLVSRRAVQQPEPCAVVARAV